MHQNNHHQPIHTNSLSQQSSAFTSSNAPHSGDSQRLGSTASIPTGATVPPLTYSSTYFQYPPPHGSLSRVTNPPATETPAAPFYPSYPDMRSPYLQSPSPFQPYTNNNFAPASETPAIPKKKRKRADANQLKVLNEVYDRTAFPSTEERNLLAKELDLTPRSVQIW